MYDPYNSAWHLMFVALVVVAQSPIKIPEEKCNTIFITAIVCDKKPL